jgi:hypothetical protein
MSVNDDKIKQLLVKVEEQKAGLGPKPRAHWETNGIFKYSDKSFFNLNTVQNFQQLVDALAFLLEKTLFQNSASEKLGVTGKAFEWNGYPIEDWQADFKKRIEIVNWQARKVQLDQTKKKLKSLISAETKTEMEIEELSKLLS